MLDNDNSLERRIYRHYWDDGLLDVFAAAGVTLIGISWLSDFPPAAAIVPAMLVPLWHPFRQRLVEPRLGFVQFSDERERLNRKRLKLTLYIGIAALILCLELYFHREYLPRYSIASMVAGLPALLLAVLAGVTALLVASARFLVHALILLVAAFTGALMGWTPGVILTVAGAAMVAVAVATLARFLRVHPLDPGPAE